MFIDLGLTQLFEAPLRATCDCAPKGAECDLIAGSYKHLAPGGAKPQVNNLRYIISTTFPKLSFDSILS